MDIEKLSLTETSLRLREGAFSATELTQCYLDRIAERNGELNAYLSVFTDDAMQQAAEADERIKADGTRGVLDGIPLALKDNILVQGKIATAGSKILESYVASFDATVVARLKRAGAVILGKTNLDEFAMGSSTEHSAFGPTRNPIDPSRVPGGSSGGSAAAVGAYLAAGALGSDTGGSVRQPASFCGVVGLKPTYGRVSRSGLIAMASSLDQIGPFGRTVEDAEAIFSVIAGYDPLDATSYQEGEILQRTPSFSSGDLRGVRIGIPKEYFGEGLDERIRKEIDRAIAALRDRGATFVEVSLPHTSYGLAVYYLIMPSEVSANLARFDGVRYGPSVLRNTKEKVNLWEVYLKTRREFFGDEAKRRIMLGTFALSAGYYDAYYGKAQKVRALIRQDFDRAFQQVDALLTPTSPTLPFRLGERTQDLLSMYLADVYTVSAPLAGIPGLSVPFGAIEEDGATWPVGVQLMGPNFSEQFLFTMGKAIEEANV